MLFKKEHNKGFTIIEVLIVLAIAGAIMLLVFLAVPALQRNSRNTRIRSDAAHLSGLLNEYVTNHNGSMPTAFGAVDASHPNNLDLTNENFSSATRPTTITATYSTPAAVTSTLYVFSGVVCNNNAPGAGSSRAFAVVFYVEPGPQLQCIDS